MSRVGGFTRLILRVSVYRSYSSPLTIGELYFAVAMACSILISRCTAIGHMGGFGAWLSLHLRTPTHGHCSVASDSTVQIEMEIREKVSAESRAFRA